MAKKQASADLLIKLSESPFWQDLPKDSRSALEEILGDVEQAVVATHQIQRSDRELELRLAEMEHRLSQARDFYNALIDNFHDPIFVKNRAHQWIFINKAFCSFIGHPRAELLGRSDCDFFPEEEAKVFWEKDDAAFSSQTTIENEEQFTDSSGKTHTISTIKSVVPDHLGREVLIGSIRDISRQKKIEEEIIQARAKAEEASKLKNEFIAKMSHELRTPLTGLLGMGDLLRATDLNEEQQDYLHTISSSAKSILYIINDLLDLSLIEAGRLKLKNVDMKLRKCLAEVEATFDFRIKEKDISFQWEVAKDVPDLLRADTARLKQILINLIGNSIKFTPRAGSIVVFVSLLEKKPRSYILEFSVIDSGVGMDSTQHENLFRTFAPSSNAIDEVQRGTGLGLSICHSLVSLMGGSIEVGSSPGVGTRISFIIEFAAAHGEEVKNAPKKTLDTITLSRPLKILVAEDNIVNQKVINGLLKRLNCEVVLTADGEEAFLAFKKEYFDLVLLDNNMPKMDGTELAQAIKALPDKEKASTPLAIVTAHAMEGDRERFLASGLDYYLSKPIRKKELCNILFAVSEGLKD